MLFAEVHNSTLLCRFTAAVTRAFFHHVEVEVPTKTAKTAKIARKNRLDVSFFIGITISLGSCFRYIQWKNERNLFPLDAPEVTSEPVIAK
jgi:hypothetical protein